MLLFPKLVLHKHLSLEFCPVDFFFFFWFMQKIFLVTDCDFLWVSLTFFVLITKINTIWEDPKIQNKSSIQKLAHKPKINQV